LKKLLLVITLIFGFVSGELLAQAYLETGKVGVSLNSYGRFRIYTPNTDGALQLDRLSILVAGDETKLTDTTGVYDYYNDGDTSIEPDTVDAPSLSDYEIFGQFNNAYSEAYPNFLVTINVYGWENSNYVIAKFTVTNKEESAINNAKVGFEVIPMIDSAYGSEYIKYNADKQVIDISYDSHVGIKFLSPAVNALNVIDWYEGYNATDISLWELMNFFSFTSDYTATGDGSVVVPSLANMNIAAGDSVEIYLAVAVDSSEAEVLTAIAAAEQKFEVIGTEDEPNIKPATFKLAQNYPNPFNPNTKISFTLPEAENVTLKVYNMLGQEVAELIKGEMSAGEHTVNFNAANLTSGMYIYKITAGSYINVKKMMLVK
jgi:hypothetical protein